MKSLRLSFLALLLPIACSAEVVPEAGADADRGNVGKADLIGSCAPEDCGGKSSGTCWCDEACADFGDCCGDKEAVCDAPCQPTDCGDKPVFVHCADGQSIAEPDLCTELEDGTCGWTAECALPDGEPECTPEDCGDKPVFIHCADGFTIAEPDLCTELEDGNCGWTAECALPEPGACTLEECGENPGFIECPGGELAAIADQCTELDDGSCGWVASGC